MKSIIPALILAIAILWGLYLLAEANRYEVSVSSSVAMRIDRRTGDTWLWAGSKNEGGWYVVGGPAEGRDR